MSVVKVIKSVPEYTTGFGLIKRSLNASIYKTCLRCSSFPVSTDISNFDRNFVIKNAPHRLYSSNKESVKNVMDFFEFSEIPNKNKQTFHEMIRIYDARFPTKKGVVDFIYSALKYMKEFGVMDDLETYKKLLDLFPKGKYLPKNQIQQMFFHFPREQFCAVEVLCHLEVNGVIPDRELGEILENIFGDSGLPTEKFYKMMYWIPKFKNKSPWPLPTKLPDDDFALAMLAIERITSVDLQSKISVFRTENIQSSIDKTWVVSGQSPTQKKLLQEHDKRAPVILEGGEQVWLRKKRVTYFVLKSEDHPIIVKPPTPLYEMSDLSGPYLNPEFKDEFAERSPHHQDDGIIYAVCATGTSKKDSLLSWIRLLQENGNPKLKDLAVLFRLKSAHDEPVPFSEAA